MVGVLVILDAHVIAAPRFQLHLLRERARPAVGEVFDDDLAVENSRTPPLPAKPSRYLPDSGAVSLPVQRTEKLSSLTCGAGLIDDPN